MAEELTFHEKIIAIQNELKAPKNQFNKFGKFNYRSCEDILEGLKPLLHNYGLRQSITDEIEQIGDRYYIRAIVKVTDGDNVEQVSAFAREPVSKKGMDDSQVTGTASSYARKYALNGMWLIDDTKDADTDEHQQVKQQKPQKEKLTPDMPRWEKAVHAVASGESNIEQVKKVVDISDKHAEQLVAEAMEFANG